MQGGMQGVRIRLGKYRLPSGTLNLRRKAKFTPVTARHQGMSGSLDATSGGVEIGFWRDVDGLQRSGQAFLEEVRQGARGLRDRKGLMQWKGEEKMERNLGVPGILAETG